MPRKTLRPRRRTWLALVSVGCLVSLGVLAGTSGAAAPASLHEPPVAESVPPTRAAPSI